MCLTFCIDLDGTLLDSSYRHYKVLEDVLKELGSEKKIDQSNFLVYKANGNSTLNYCINKLGFSKKVGDKITSLWINNIEKPEYMQYDKLFADVLPFLEYLQKKKYSITLITARTKPDLVHFQLRQLKINPFFDQVYVVNPFYAASEKKEILNKFCKRKVVIVGDTEIEADLAVILNIESIILNRGFRSKQYFEKKGISSVGGLDKTLVDHIALKASGKV